MGYLNKTTTLPSCLAWILTFAILLPLGPVCGEAASGRESDEDEKDTDYPARVLSLHRQILYRGDGTGETRVQMRTRVLNEVGRQILGQATVNFRSDSHEVEFVHVRVVKPGGEVLATSLNNIMEVTPPAGLQYPMYSDYKTKVVPISGLQVGDVIEQSIIIRVVKPSIPGHFFVNIKRYGFLPIEEEVIVLDLPTDREIAMDDFGSEPEDVETADGRIVRRWRFGNTEPSEQPQNPVFSASTMTSWEAFGDWYADLVEPAVSMTPELESLAAELTAGAITHREKAERIYKYVCRSIRYVGLAFGISSYQPNMAEDTFRNQYGDCKDKHVLLETLLAAVGIRAYPALVNLTFDITESVPSPDQFNHVISVVRIGEEPVWLDTTPGLAPFGVLNPVLYGDRALLLDGDGYRMATIPSAGPGSNRMALDIAGRIDEVGDLEADLSFSVSGWTGVSLRTGFLQAGDDGMKTVMELLLAEAGFPGEIVAVKHADPHDLSDPFTYRLTISVDDFLDPFQRTVDLEIPSLLHNDFVRTADDLEDSDGEEPQPVPTGGPLIREETLKLDLPDGISVDLPPGMESKQPYGRYVSDYLLEDGGVRINRTVELDTVEIDRKQYPMLVAFSNLVQNDLGKILRFRRSADADLMAATEGADVEYIARAAYVLAERQEIEKARELARRAIEAKPESAEAWFDIGRTFGMTGNATGAIEALNRVLQIDPDHRNARTWVDNLLTSTGGSEEKLKMAMRQVENSPDDPAALFRLIGELMESARYEESEANLIKYLSMSLEKDLVVWGHTRLGEVRLRQGTVDDAMAEFEKALELDRDPKVYNDIAYALAETGYEIDRAHRYAASAVDRLVAEVRLLDSLKGWKRSLEMQEGLAASLDTLGWVEFKRGNAAEALPLLETAYSLSRHDVMAIHMLEAASAAEQYDKAMLYYGVISLSENTAPFGDGEPRSLPDKLQKHVTDRFGGEVGFREHLIGRLKEIGARGNFVKLPEGRFTDPGEAITTGMVEMVFALALVGNDGEILATHVPVGRKPWSDAAAADMRKITFHGVKVHGEALKHIERVSFFYPRVGSISATMGWGGAEPMVMGMGN